MPVEFPHPGISTWRTPSGARVLRLHYAADPRKDAIWAEREKKRTNDHALWRQEQEIDFSALQGQLIYHQFDAEASLEDEFEVPPDWTRYYGLDPHPAVPHAHLWAAVDPWGDLWFYRELWPSKVAFKFEDGIKTGKPGNVPEDDNRFTIKQYVETVQWLESDENEQNADANGKRFNENIYQRVIDFTARAFDKASVEDPTRVNYQSKYEMYGRELNIDMNFQDAKKDHGAGEELVNELLKPREVELGEGFTKKSRIRIMKQRCPELIYQIQNLRRKTLTPQQAEVMDPTGKAIEKRNHLTDLMRYIVMAEPRYVGGSNPVDSWNPNVGGVAS